MPATTLTRTYGDLLSTTRDNTIDLRPKITDIASTLTGALTKAKKKGKWRRRQKNGWTSDFNEAVPVQK